MPLPKKAKEIERARAGPAARSAPSAERSVHSVESGLVDRILAGETECFYDLIRRYEWALYATAWAIVKNEAEAEEVVQDAIIKALRHLGRFRRESKFSTWLTQITINEGRMRLRKARRHVHQSLDETPAGHEGEYQPKDFADWREIPSECFERKELREALRRAIDGLAPMYRAVLLLRDVQNLSTAETASVLAITVEAVKTRLLRARLQVRDALAPGIDGAWSLGETKWKKVRAW